jgi:hypothetical protein
MVDDENRLAPPVIFPGICGTQEVTAKAPSDAIVLFDGKDLSNWSDVKGQTIVRTRCNFASKPAYGTASTSELRCYVNFAPSARLRN